MPWINLGAYVYEPAPVAGPHRALGPPVGRGKSFIGPPIAVALYGPDNPMIDALQPSKATLGAQMRHRGGAGPQPPPPPLAIFMALLVALQSKEDLDRGHKGSPGNFQGGRAVHEEKIQGPYGSKNTK